MSEQIMFHVKPSKKFPWRERNVIYLTLLSYSLWGRKIFWAFFPATRSKKDVQMN